VYRLSDPVSPQHTRHALEALHPNIGVFRHPDHAPAGYDLRSDFEKLRINNFDLAKASGSALQNLFGQMDDVVLYWAHHEKLLVVDDRIAFMGGLDLCTWWSFIILFGLFSCSGVC